MKMLMISYQKVEQIRDALIDAGNMPLANWLSEQMNPKGNPQTYEMKDGKITPNKP